MLRKNQIFVILILIIVIAIFSFFYFKNRNTFIKEDIFSLPKGTVLTEAQKQKFEEAKAILEDDPSNAEALIKIAQVKYDIYDLEGSKKVYLKALEFKPDDLLILNNLADIYNQLKDYENAEKILLKLTETSPGWINGFRELKTLYRFHLKEKYPQIEGILLKGLEGNKELYGEAPVDFYAMLATFYKDTGQKEKAIPYYEKVLELDPNNEGAKIDLEELKKSS